MEALQHTGARGCKQTMQQLSIYFLITVFTTVYLNQTVSVHIKLTTSKPLTESEEMAARPHTEAP